MNLYGIFISEFPLFLLPIQAWSSVIIASKAVCSRRECRNSPHISLAFAIPKCKSLGELKGEVKIKENEIPRHKWHVSEETGKNKDLPQTKSTFCWIEGRHDKIFGAQCLDIPGTAFSQSHQGDSKEEKKSSQREMPLEHLDRWKIDSQALNWHKSSRELPELKGHLDRTVDSQWESSPGPHTV